MKNQYLLGGRTYSFGMVPATEAVFLELEIARLIGEPLFKVFAAPKDQKEDNVALAGTVIGLICSKADPDQFLKMLQTIFKYTSCDGQRVDIDATFTGHNREMIQVFAYGLRYNFQDFFPESLLASIRAKMAGLTS